MKGHERSRESREMSWTVQPYLKWSELWMELSLSSNWISTIFHHVRTYLTTVDDDLNEESSAIIVIDFRKNWHLWHSLVDKCSSPESNSSYLLTRRTVLSLPNPKHSHFLFKKNSLQYPPRIEKKKNRRGQSE